MRKLLILLLIISFLGFILISCNPYSFEKISEGASYEHVIFIGIDGAGSYFEKYETFANIFSSSPTANAVVNYHATSETPSVSAQNWGSYLHGVSPSVHKCVNGSISCERFPYTQYPSIFKIIREVYPSSSLVSFSEWNSINYGLIEPSARVYKSSDKRFCATVYTTKEIEDMTLEYLTANASNLPQLMFVHLESVDEAGHSNGYGSEKYLEELQQNIEFISQIDKKLDYSKTLLIVATDHGGLGTNHGGSSPEEMDITIAIKGYSVSGTISSSTTPKDIATVILKALGIKTPSFMEGKSPENLVL